MGKPNSIAKVRHRAIADVGGILLEAERRVEQHRGDRAGTEP